MVHTVLGILRFFLASCVIVYHLSGHVPSIGILSVNFFYVISGYLMTLVLNEVYCFNPQSFCVNRVLRLYPSQLALCAVSLALIWTLPEAVKFHPMWGNPKWSDWIGNILIFPWSFLTDQHLRILPAAWSIAVEIWCYFFLWLFVSRRPWTAALSMILAIWWQAHLFYTGASADAHYFPVTAALLPFSCGAISYFIISHPRLAEIERNAKQLTQGIILCAVVALFLINWRLAVWFDRSAYYGFFYYTNTLLACVAVISLHGLKARGRFAWFAAWCGDLSYPIFLAQWVCGFVAWHILGTDGPMRGWSVLTLGYILSVLVGVATIKFIDRPIHQVRARIRSNPRGTLSGATSGD
jgi:peptidoglycan/LPS O-acetylase OafA/YrhL